MSLLMFEGAAGTGKTTRLLAAARKYLEAQPLDPNQRVLALTKYHGSRRRMDNKLRDLDSGIGNALDCVTIDSFASNIIRRWRSLVDYLGLEIVEGDFSSVTGVAGTLLQRPQVAKWAARRYPVVVVDEMQDCKAGEVQMIAGLERHVRLLCGADAFQDLSGDTSNEAITWASAVGEVVPLQEVHRTDNSELLAAAHALRSGQRLHSKKYSGFEIVSTPKAPLAGAILSWRIRSWSRYGPIAIISATKPGTSPFPDQVVEWVSTRTAKSTRSTATAGPYALDWESGDDAVTTALLDGLCLPQAPDTILDCLHLVLKAEDLGHHDVRDWLRRQRFVRGISTVTVAEVRDEVSQIVRRRRAFGPTRPWRRRAMTIHQAKNREFESVVVLWPMKLPGVLEGQRRLLYNAITRAKERAIVIVQDPRRNRLKEPLFVGGQ